MLPRGLGWHLAAWVAVVMLVSAGAVFVVVYSDTGSQIRAEVDRDVSSDTSQFAQAMSSLRTSSSARAAALARHYVIGQPYSASSTLLFALIPGQRPASNHPEVFGRSAETGEPAAEQARENEFGRKLLVPRLGYSTQHVPDVGAMRIHQRLVPLGAQSMVVGAAEPLSTVSRAQRGVARAFLLAGLVVLGLALIASYIAGSRVSAPLRRMASVAARVDAGDLAPRMKISPRASDELRVLAEAFNHMLDRLEAAFRGQREFVADASHELRTPLTVIRGQLEVLAAYSDPSADEVHSVNRIAQTEIARIDRLVDDLLLLARSEQANFLQPTTVRLRAFLRELWDGISLTADRRFELGHVPDGSLRADPDRLAQALRNLARNAIEHTSEVTGLVRLDVQAPGDGQIRFAVTDDGPGIAEDQRHSVFERFHRVDTGRSRAGGGAGLGLAIVRAIAEAHGGYVQASDPEGESGARIVLVLPGFSKASSG